MPNFQPEYLQTAQEIEVDMETIGEVSLLQSSWILLEAIAGQNRHFYTVCELNGPLSPLAQNQYMGFKVVLSKLQKIKNKPKYLWKHHNCG